MSSNNNTPVILLKIGSMKIDERKFKFIIDINIHFFYFNQTFNENIVINILYFIILIIKIKNAA